MAIKDLPRFYAEKAKVGDTFALLDSELSHAKVLRLQADDDVQIADGLGNLYEGEIVLSKRSIEVRVAKKVQSLPKDDCKLTLAVAPTKNINRFEWIVEKATELGVGEILPIKSSNSERIHLKTDRLKKIAVSAMKQSKSLWLPVIHELVDIEEGLRNEAEHKWIAHCKEGEKSGIEALSKANTSQIVFIGPEGDFTSEEIDLACSKGFQPLSLGSKRLRTETAAIAACIAANLFRD